VDIVQQNRKAVLIGGPRTFDGEVVELADDLAAKVRVPHAAGHEHFTRSTESRLVDGEYLPVFTWSYGTKIAE
jgi:CO dehydrogenase/acetyl-CoA synthase epsilon subunit